MEPLEALRKHIEKPELYPITEITVNNVGYVAFGDFAFKKDAVTPILIYGKTDEFYSLESVVVFMRNNQENHGTYVKEAAAANVRAVTRIDRKNVQEYLQGDRMEVPNLYPQSSSTSLKQLLHTEEPAAKRSRLEGEEAQERAQEEPKKEVEVRALNDSLTVDRIAEMRRKRQLHQMKHSQITEAKQTPVPAALPETHVYNTRDTVMLGKKDLSNVLEVLASAQRQWRQGEKKEVRKVEKVISDNRNQSIGAQQQRSGYSRYAQEAFADENVREFETFRSFVGSAVLGVKSEKPVKNEPPPVFAPIKQEEKRAHRTPIIVVPSAMNSMINLYNARDILQELGFVSVEQRKREINKRPVDTIIQRQKNGHTINIRVMDNAEKLANEDWDRVIAVFVMGVAWQFKGWKWNGNPTDIFTHIPAFYLHFDNDKPSAQVLQWSVHKIPVSSTKRHMDKARFSQVWETIENFVRKNKPMLNSRLGLRLIN